MDFSYLAVCLLFFLIFFSYFVVRIWRRRKKFTFAILSSDEFLVICPMLYAISLAVRQIIIQ